ncbi:MAG: CocE/NonD family hydrolase [Bacteroidetes bacterium]|nr:CocE/NonD family hydrolase [Bacteroidota bacterium]
MKKIFLLVSLITGWHFSAAQSDTLAYTRRTAMISMRDGIKLFTVIYAPAVQKEAYPILFLRTPYGVAKMPSPNLRDYTADLAKDGYIFVFQDIRGRYQSEGTFEMQRFTRDRKNPKAIDESTDTYDAIEWLLKNVKGNNGKVGMFGISYAGWTTMMGTIDAHPALKAVSEQASPSDMWMGDDFHHNGAFRLSYGFEYAYMEEATKEDAMFPFDTYDTYDWYLKLGPLYHVNEKFFHGKIPSWNDFANHPNYDDFWKNQALPSRLGAPTIPNLHVAGYWDQEDFYGPLKAYEVLEKQDHNNKNFIVIGPWNHGGWGRGNQDALGNVRFGVPTAQQFRQQIQATWFAFHLKGKDDPKLPEGNGFTVQGLGQGKFPEAVTFQTGSNTWKSYSSWPPKEASVRNLYFREDGRLTFDAPASEGFDTYVSDPSKPVPYRMRPIEATYGPGSRWYTWLTEDQRFVHNRPDVLSWQTETLTEDIAVTGQLIASLFASTSGTDSDWIVKLIDVYPDQYPEEPKMSGYQLMIANDVFRGRFYRSFEKPEALKPGEVNLFPIDLHAANHVFRKGHRIMVQVQSTWFPVIDRNPQSFVPNIFDAKESDFQPATQKVYRSPGFPSHIKLPVMK